MKDQVGLDFIYSRLSLVCYSTKATVVISGL